MLPHFFRKEHRSYHYFLLSAAASENQFSVYSPQRSCFLLILLYTHQHSPKYLQSYLLYQGPFHLLPGILPDSSASSLPLHSFRKEHRSYPSLLLSVADSGNPLSAYNPQRSCFLLILLYTHQHLPKYPRSYLLYQGPFRLLPGILPDSSASSLPLHSFRKEHRSYPSLLLSVADSGNPLSAYNPQRSCFLLILLYTHQHLPKYPRSYLLYQGPFRLLPGILPDSSASSLPLHSFRKEHRSYPSLLLSVADSGNPLSAYNPQRSCFLLILLYTHQHLPKYPRSYLLYQGPFRLLPGILPDSSASSLPLHSFRKEHRSYPSLLLSVADSGNPLSAYNPQRSCFLLILLYTHQHLPKYPRSYLLYQGPFRLLPGILPDSSASLFRFYSSPTAQIKQHSCTA